MKPKRLLPEYVHAFKDRHGKQRLRFRRTGYPSGYFTHLFGTEGFREEYRAFLDRSPMRAGRDRALPGSMADLLARYLRSGDFSGADVTRAKNRRILENYVADRKDWPVAEVTWEPLENLLKKKADTHPAAARNLRKQLARLFAFAKRARMIRDNPMAEVKIKVPKTEGHHTWTEEEVWQYQEKHKLGTTARLALELMLWTGNRRGDASSLRKDQIKRGAFEFAQEKGKKALRLPMAAPLAEAIAAMPAHPAPTIIANAHGKPFTKAGFGNRMRKWCDAAGLPHCSAHGLRKAISRRLAEAGEGNQQIKSITLHSQDAEVAHYTKQANQAALAAETMKRLEAWVANRVSNRPEQSEETAENSRERS